MRDSWELVCSNYAVSHWSNWYLYSSHWNLRACTEPKIQFMYSRRGKSYSYYSLLKFEQMFSLYKIIVPNGKLTIASYISKCPVYKIPQLCYFLFSSSLFLAFFLCSLCTIKWETMRQYNLKEESRAKSEKLAGEWMHPVYGICRCQHLSTLEIQIAIPTTGAAVFSSLLTRNCRTLKLVNQNLRDSFAFKIGPAELFSPTS